MLPIYTGEDLKPHTVGVLCFKLLPIPHHGRFKTARFKSSMVYTEMSKVISDPL